jgi:hydrogenase nickel incorporation protein HypA/HybF
MHELSIAMALVDLVRQHAPAGVLVHRVKVCAGPVRAIEPQAMQLAWQAATQQSDLDGAELQLINLPWELNCPECKRSWQSEDPLANCVCGCDQPRVSASNELTLLELDVDDLPGQTPARQPVSNPQEVP